MVIAAAAVVLLLSCAVSEAQADVPQSVRLMRIQHVPEGIPTVAPEGQVFAWERDLRWFTFRLLKDIRRSWIRLTRLLRRSAEFWLAWLGTALGYTLAGGIASAVDRRLLALVWQRGPKVALAYAGVGVVVFLRLLRDRRVKRRLRWIMPLAIVYAIAAPYWIDLRYAPLNRIDEFVVVVLAARWFVRRCPDAVVEGHASVVRARTFPQLLAPSKQRQPQS